MRGRGTDSFPASSSTVPRLPAPEAVEQIGETRSGQHFPNVFKPSNCLVKI